MSGLGQAAKARPHPARDASQLRLLLEELCCDLCRFIHVREGLAPEAVAIDREFWLGRPGAFADICVRPLEKPAYCVEVKHGYPDDTLVSHMARKYGAAEAPAFDKLLLVIDIAQRPDWPRTLEALRKAIHPRLTLQVWDESELLTRLRECFDVRVDSLSADDLLDVRVAIDHAKGRHAFGDEGGYEHDPLKAELLWHFSFWRLRQLREAQGLTPRQILQPGLYPEVAVLIADLCGFSSYMRDTPDAEVTRESLTAFYSKARSQIIDRGGMLYQFVGDEVIGLFGLPEPDERAAEAALDAACALASIGKSVADSWQRQIDRVQASGGLHMGLSTGEVQIVSLRPYSRTHMGALGDSVNVAARLMAQAGPGEIVATNSFHRRLGSEARSGFEQMAPLEAKNVGKINGWKMRVAAGVAD